MFVRLPDLPLSVRLSYAVPVLIGLVALAAQRSVLDVPSSVLVLAVLFDATVVSALIAWWAVPSSRRRTWELGVFAARGLAVAAVMFPALRSFLWLEALALTALLVHALTGLRSPLPDSYRELDDVERAYAWWDRLLLPTRLVRAVVFERLLFTHLLTRPRLPEGTHFGTRRDATTGGVIGAVVFVSVVEGVLTHVLLAPRFPALAWVLTVLSALGALWLTAFGRALATRPVTVGARRVYLRSGLRWTLSVPRADVLEARPYDASTDASLQTLTVGNPPNVTLVFRTPVRLLGVYGAQRSVQGVTLHLDDAVGFRRAVARTG